MGVQRGPRPQAPPGPQAAHSPSDCGPSQVRVRRGDGGSRQGDLPATAPATAASPQAAGLGLQWGRGARAVPHASRDSWSRCIAVSLLQEAPSESQRLRDGRAAAAPACPGQPVSSRCCLLAAGRVHERPPDTPPLGPRQPGWLQSVPLGRRHLHRAAAKRQNCPPLTLGERTRSWCMGGPASRTWAPGVVTESFSTWTWVGREVGVPLEWGHGGLVGEPPSLVSGKAVLPHPQAVRDPAPGTSPG